MNFSNETSAGRPNKGYPGLASIADALGIATAFSAQGAGSMRKHVCRPNFWLKDA